MQIEEGKYYRTRDGRKVGPLKRGEQFPVGGPWMFKDETHYYQTSGKSCRGTNGFDNHPEDNIVAEWVDEPAIVAVIRDGTPSPAIRPVVHPSTEAATAEARRLARQNPGQEFAVFQRVAGVVAEVTLKDVA